MRTRVLLALLASTVLAARIGVAAITLTPVADLALTPNETDSIGVFSRWFPHAGRDRFYEIYAGRPPGSSLAPGLMSHLAWREYDATLGFTGRSGSLAGVPSAGDFAFAQVDSTYFVVSVDGFDYRLSSFDDDFRPLGHTVLPLDIHDSNTDQLIGYGDGRLLIGSLHEPTATHPRFPMQAAWTPSVHLFQYDTSLQAAAADRYLAPTFYSWGGSATFNPVNHRFVVVSMDSFPTYQLFAYEYDETWTLLGQHLISHDGQWSQGLLWDGAHYFVAYHSGHEHRCGNIVLAAFDIDWNPEASVTLTQLPSFPPPLGPGLNVQRPFVTRVGDSLFVSYDAGHYTYLGTGHFLEDKDWQAHVSVVRLGTTASVPGLAPAAALSVRPVPAHARLDYTVGSDGRPVDVELLDLSGRVLDRRAGSASSGAFDLGAGPPGVYFVRARLGGTSVVRRVVKI